jgi:hypothetical protein
MSEPVHPQPLPRRRAVLAASWRAAALLILAGSLPLSGCRSGTPAAVDTPPPTPTPDEVLRRRAVARVRRLLAAVSVPPERPALGPVFTRLAAGYTEQLAALGEPVTGSGSAFTTASGSAPAATSGSSSSGTPAPTSSASAGGTSSSTAPAGPGADMPTTPAAIVAAQLAAATEALADCVGAAAVGMAVLLARLAAAHAAGADLLSSAARLPAPSPIAPASAPLTSGTTGPAVSADSATTGGTRTSGGTPSGGSATSAGMGAPAGTPTGMPSPSVQSLRPDQETALGRLLQGEHAAVYAYGIVTAWVTPALRARARSGWTAHLNSRDELTRLLTGAGVTAPAASPAYDTGQPPRSSADAVALAARVEGRLAALAASAVGATSDGARLVAARVLVTSARRQTEWTASVSALPG